MPSSAGAAADLLRSYLALVWALVAGLTLRIPFSVLVKLGQDYLPNRPGTASAVTLGLSVSAGGATGATLSAAWIGATIAAAVAGLRAAFTAAI